MATSITDFLIRVKVQGQQLVDKLKTSVTDTDNEFKKATTSANKFSTSIKGIGSSAVGLVGGMAGVVAAVTALGSRVVNTADNIQDMADATGISAGRLLNLKQSLIQAGGSAEDMEKMTSKLSVTLGDAASGNEKTRKTFKDLGVALGDANGRLRSTDELLPEILSQLAKIEDPATRAATAVELLGKSASKIDWTKVSAINDPFKDEEIAQLAKYRSALDDISNTIETKLITTFGRLAIAMQDPFSLASLETFNAYLTKLTKNIFPGAVSLATGTANKIAEILGVPQRMMMPDIIPSTAGAGRGKFGGPTASQLEAAGLAGGAPGGNGELAVTEAGKQQLANAQAQTKALMATNSEAAKYAMLLNDTIGMQQYAGDIARGNLNIDKERDSKLADINKQIETELNNKERDSRVTAGLVAQLREQGMQIIQQADIMKAAKTDEINKLQQQKDLMSDIMLLNQVISQNTQLAQLSNQNALIGLYGDELKLKQGLMTIENERINAAVQIENKLRALGKNATTADIERANKEIEMAKTVANAKTKILEDQLAREKALRENASAGAEQALEAITRSMDPFQKAQSQVNNMWSTMGSAIDSFVETGKFSFGDFTRSIIQDLLKIELKSQASKLFSAAFGSGGFLSSLLGFAEGGQPPVNKPSIVGEKGPELFMPKTAGTIIPNDQLGGLGGGQSVVNNYITNNNVSAIDGQSVARFFAENRRTMLGTMQLAQKELPYGNR